VIPFKMHDDPKYRQLLLQNAQVLNVIRRMQM
jgi:hypothetical protein